MMQLPRIPSSQELFFSGRPGDPRLGEWVKPIDAPPCASKKERIVLFGCPDDQGVTLNRGRKGASGGPDSIRRHLYKMALPMDLEWEKKIELFDLGNILLSDSIEKTHAHAHQIAEALSQAQCTVIALGGGHDFAAPNFLGWAGGLKGAPKVGLINVDPHLDVRPLENGKPHSGTPFRQILDSKKLRGENFIQFGTRANRNARSHFEFCKKEKVQILPLETLPLGSEKIALKFKSILNALSKKTQTLGLTIDMDSAMEAEGTSAAPTVGFTTRELVSFGNLAGLKKKIHFLEIAEVAPVLDTHERSSRIAAEILFSFLYARALSIKSR